jgi:hypothetical protein
MSFLKEKKKKSTIFLIVLNPRKKNQNWRNYGGRLPITESKGGDSGVHLGVAKTTLKAL